MTNPTNWPGINELSPEAREKVRKIYEAALLEAAKAGYRAIQMVEFANDVDIPDWDAAPQESRDKAIALLRDVTSVRHSDDPETRYRNLVFYTAANKSFFASAMEATPGFSFDEMFKKAV